MSSTQKPKRGRPRKPRPCETDQNTIISVYTTRGARDKLAAIAGRESRSLSRQVTRVLEGWLKDNPHP